MNDAHILIVEDEKIVVAELKTALLDCCVPGNRICYHGGGKLWRLSKPMPLTWFLWILQFSTFHFFIHLELLRDLKKIEKIDHVKA